MKISAFIRYLVVSVTFAASCAHAAPVVNPYAAGLDASAYSSDSFAGAAEKVFNGDYWNGGRFGPFWMQADMGVSRTLSEVRLILDVSPANDFASYFVYLSDTSIQGRYSSFSPVASYTDFAQAGPLNLTFAPASGRYLEIVVNGGASWTALGGGPKTTWTDTGGQVTTPIPEPETYAMMLAGLGLIGAFARRRKAQPTA